MLKQCKLCEELSKIRGEKVLCPKCSEYGNLDVKNEAEQE